MTFSKDIENAQPHDESREHDCASQGCGLSNTHPSNTKIVASGIDTLHVGYRGPLRADVLADLERKRVFLVSGTDAARSAWNAGGAETDFEICGNRFALLPRLSKGCRYEIANDDVALYVNPKPLPNGASIRAQLRACFLWRAGWKQALALTNALVAELLAPISSLLPPIVSRLDLCVDFQGWSPRPEDAARLVARSKKRTEHTDGDAFTGFTFGRGGLTARLYNKTIEIASSHKEWMRSLWELSGYQPSEQVWRLEFQVRREAARELNLDIVSDLDGALGGVWRYMTNRWLRLAVPTRDRRERWPLDPAWERLQRAAFDSIGGEAVRTHKRNADAKLIDRQLFGCLTSHSALMNTRTLDRAIESLRARCMRRLARDSVEFADLVEMRQRRLQGVRLGGAPVSSGAEHVA